MRIAHLTLDAILSISCRIGHCAAGARALVAGIYLKGLLGASLLIATSGCFSATSPQASAVSTYSVGACNPLPCAKITIATLPDLPDTFAPAAVTTIRHRVDDALYAPLEDTEQAITRERLIEGVQAQYDDYMTVKDSETVVDWQLSRSAFIVFANEDFASLVVKNEGYLGGAHGFSDEQLFVFDGKSGKLLTWDDILSPGSREVFVRAAEAEFRRARDIKPGQSLEDAGFTFEGGAFTLSRNFAVTDRGISLHYNPYEVGPYVMGATDCMVPMDVARPALKLDVSNLAAVGPSGGLL